MAPRAIHNSSHTACTSPFDSFKETLTLRHIWLLTPSPWNPSPSAQPLPLCSQCRSVSSANSHVLKSASLIVPFTCCLPMLPCLCTPHFLEGTIAILLLSCGSFIALQVYWSLYLNKNAATHKGSYHFLIQGRDSNQNYRLLYCVASAIDSTFKHEMKAQLEAAQHHHHRRLGWLWSASAAFVSHFLFSWQAQRQRRVSTHHVSCLVQTCESYQHVSMQPFNFPSQWLWQIVFALISFCSKQQEFKKIKKRNPGRRKSANTPRDS